MHPDFILPNDSTLNFSGIPAFVQQQFKGTPDTALAPANWQGLNQPFKRVVTLFVDAFGWRFFERFQDHPLLRRFARNGSITKLTSQFPSTTCAHVTTLYTGLPVNRHGVYEWFYYEPRVDAVVAPLLFAYAGDEERESLARAGVNAADILPRGHVSAILARQGAQSYIFQPWAFFESTFSKQMGAGARMLPYMTISEGLATITQTLNRATHPIWLVGYFDSFDTVCHIHGPDQPQSDAELDTILTVIQRWLERDMSAGFDHTLVMLIADHGQIDINPATTLYIDQAPGFAKLRPLLRTTRREGLLAPAGACRDYFVYAREEHLEEAQYRLAAIVGDRGEVCRVAELIEQGYFGSGAPSKVFQARLGNLVVLPYPGQSVFWLGDGRFQQKFCGHHGGLTPQEMEIPLLLLPL